MLNSNGPSMEPCGTPKIISGHELYVPFNFTLYFGLVKYECNSFKERKKGYLPHKHEVQRFVVHEVNNRRLQRDQLVEFQRHHLRRVIFSNFEFEYWTDMQITGSHPEVFCRKNYSEKPLVKKRLQHRCLFFYANFAKYFRTAFLQSEAATGGVLQKKVSLKIWQISQENTCVRVSF